MVHAMPQDPVNLLIRATRFSPSNTHNLITLQFTRINIRCIDRHYHSVKVQLSVDCSLDVFPANRHKGIRSRLPIEALVRQSWGHQQES